ncbi:EAL domain-containing protein [uncultured Sphingomonas sp.]|jgi:EAL domain-containing protein (putative c-di-GMP-specific phosphodiesterase class I)|uniref:EAL domain-containing protein n=1 Tax=uncultured Sphingomonas sp. TaxID=158754 RepID=UPI0035CC13E8
MIEAARIASRTGGTGQDDKVFPERKLIQDSRAFLFHLLIEIANFTALRRHIGLPRAEMLPLDLAQRATAALPGVDIAPVGRASLGLWFYGSERRDLERVERSVRALFAAPIDLDGEQHRVELIVGGAFASSHGADEVRIAEDAEAALSNARDAHNGAAAGVRSCEATDARALARELDRAIGNDELLLMYQPKIHVRRQEIGSAEGLMRWRHPTRGLILPGDFIPVAEESQLIGRMTLWAIRRAIADQRTLAARSHDLRLFINISGQLLADTAFVREACDLVANSDTKLGFEITETSVIRDPESAIANLQIFADYGIIIAIDDYGAGLSSLAYLKQLPARELKIDKLFITKLTSSNRDPLIVRSTIDLAHALEMEVVAEGVETHAALALLTVMGCDMVQGFLISRPIALDALISYLDEGRHQAAPIDARPSLTELARNWKRG